MTFCKQWILQTYSVLIKLALFPFAFPFQGKLILVPGAAIKCNLEDCFSDGWQTESQLHKSRQTQHRLLFITHQMAHMANQKKPNPQMSDWKLEWNSEQYQHHKSKPLLVLDLQEQLSVLTQQISLQSRVCCSFWNNSYIHRRDPRLAVSGGDNRWGSTCGHNTWHRCYSNMVLKHLTSKDILYIKVPLSI